MGFEKYPGFEEQLEELCRTRRNEILQAMVENDKMYGELRSKRTRYSMRLREALGDKINYLEEYADAVYEQECYELDALYRQGMLDALSVITQHELT